MNNNDISKQFSKDLLDAVKQILGQGQIDEASTYEKNKQYIEVTHTSGNKKKVPVHPLRVKAALNRYRNDPATKSARIVSEAEIDPDLEDELKKTRQTTKSVADAKKRYMTKPVKEEAEDLDEAVEVRHDRYMRSHGKKASGGGAWMFTHKASGEAKGDDTFTAPSSARTFTDAAKHAKAWGKSKGHRTVYVMEETELTEMDKERGSRRDYDTQRGMDKTAKPMTVKKFAAAALKTLNKEEVENIDELSRATVGRYSMKAKSIADNEGGKDRTKGRELAGRKRWGGTMSGVKPARVPATEEVQLTQEEIERLNAIAQELDEARGRPPKEGSAAWKARQAAAKAGEEEKSEPRQHIMQQLQRAKLSMHGGSDVKFENGETHNIKGTHAAKLLDKYAGMKPFEKEAFQKKIGKSHENLKDEL